MDKGSLHCRLFDSHPWGMLKKPILFYILLDLHDLEP